MDCSYGGDCSNVKAQANGVHVPASEDPSRLRIAEYIKFFGVNKEPVAVEHFADVSKAYNDMKTSMATKPVTAWMNYYNGVYTISAAHYKKAYVVDAGGALFDAEAALDGVKGLSVTTPATGKSVKIAI